MLIDGISQSYTLIKLNGLMNKDDNIYFVPLFRTYGITKIIDKPLSEAFYYCFIRETKQDTNYININISQWAPEDRTITIEGTVDMFRKGGSITESPFDYILIRRKVNNQSRYYGYFIDSVSQEGRNTVKLNLTSDDFSNCFYFSKTNEKLTETGFNNNYSPFNHDLTNVYVNRQHYDRVKLMEDSEGNYIATPTNKDIFFNTEEEFKYRYLTKTLHTPIIIEQSEDNCFFSENELDTIKSSASFFHLAKNNLPLAKRVLKTCLAFAKIIAKENITTGFKYATVRPASSYYYNNSYLGYYSYNMSSSLPIYYIPFINIPPIFSHLYDIETYTKIIVKSLFIQGSTTGTLPDIDITNSAKDFLKCVGEYGYGEYIESIQIVKNIPFFSGIEYNVSFSDTTINAKLIVSISFNTNPIEFIHKQNGDLSETNNFDFATNSLPRGINFVTLCGGPLVFNREEKNPYYNSYEKIKNYGTDILYDNSTKKTSIFNNQNEVKDTTKKFYASYNIMGAFVLSSPTATYVEGKLSPKTLNNLLYKCQLPLDNKDSFFDLCLEKEGYNSYTISLYGVYETPLSFFRMFEDNKIDITYNINFSYIDSSNAITKLGVIPEYEDIYYYNEAIVVSLSDTLPISSSSYFSFLNENRSSMKAQYAVTERNANINTILSWTTGMADQTVSGFSKGFSQAGLLGGSVGGGAGGFSGLMKGINSIVKGATAKENLKLQQNAKLADMGAKPDTIKQAGSDLLYDMKIGELGFYLNRYEIDKTSYNSICRYLERYGYLVNIYDNINATNRIYWNYVKLEDFDFDSQFYLSLEQKINIKRIFQEGVTLSHTAYSSQYEYHNIETLIWEVI